MNFDRVSGTITQYNRQLAHKKFQGLALELGVREDNEHVGSGLGGNNGQLFALMSLSHHLVDNDSLSIKIDQGKVQWGEIWLRRAKRRDIRMELDTTLPVPKTATFDDIRQDARFALGPNAANLNLYTFAVKLCADLASELDKGDDSNVRATALALSGFPMEIVLVSVRRYIQIGRLVKHNLDEHQDFGKILSTINKVVD
jgi:hypothetical protein